MSSLHNWISVNEKLPEPNQITLVCVRKKEFSIVPKFRVDIGCYIGNGVWQYKYESGGLITYEPEYWMPLPEHKFISVAENHPETHKITLVCVRKKEFSIEPKFRVDIGCYIGNGVWQYKYESYGLIAYEPEYWMPLPELPH